MVSKNNFFSGKTLNSADLQKEQNYVITRNPNEDKEETNMTPTSTRKDPYKKYNFIVEIDGIAEAGFTECSGLDQETEIIEYREGSDMGPGRKLPGLTTYSNIVLRRGVANSKDLWNWRKTILDGQVERKNGAVVLLVDKHQEVARWVFHEGWISFYSGPELNAKESDVAIEEIEICHEGLERGN